MKTYFIRHAMSCDMGAELRDSLWKQRMIAVHYEDKRSWEPDDYDASAAKKSLRILNEIADEGGFICATIAPRSGCLIGEVAPGTQKEFETGPKQSDGSQSSTLKAIRLSKCVEVCPHEANRLLICQPLQGTLTQWHVIGDRIERYVRDGRLLIQDLCDLLPYEQEIMCSEFLRTETATERGLPQLVHLSAPVGQTRKAVDTAGIATDGKLLLVQVTYRSRSDKAVNEKVADLREVAQGISAHLLFFCHCQKPTTEDGVQFFPLQEVFDAMRRLPTWCKAMSVEERSN